MNPLSLLSLIPRLFTTVDGITNAIANERLKLIQAKSDKEKIDSQERLSTLEAQRQVLLAKTGHWETRALMFALGVGPAFILNKIYIWDKALGDWTGGHTDPLDQNLWWVITAQIGFYFLASIFRK